MKESTARTIKRYANRKLYDTKESCYVTLDQIAVMIRHGEDVKVIDNNSKEDLTSITLAQILFEEEKKRRSFLPLSALRNIIQSSGDSLHDLMNQLSESAERVGRVFRSEGDEEGAEEKAPGSAADEAGDQATTQGVKDKGPDKTDPTRMVKDVMEGVQKTMEDWQKRLDQNVHNALESVSPLAPVQKELQALGERLAKLERAVATMESTPPDAAPKD